MREIRSVGDADTSPFGSAVTLDTLEDVLRWGADVLEVVVQDEYTHDVICERRGTPGYVIFDTT